MRHWVRRAGPGCGHAAPFLARWWAVLAAAERAGVGWRPGRSHLSAGLGRMRADGEQRRTHAVVTEVSWVFPGGVAPGQRTAANGSEHVPGRAAGRRPAAGKGRAGPLRERVTHGCRGIAICRPGPPGETPAHSDPHPGPLNRLSMRNSGGWRHERPRHRPRSPASLAQRARPERSQARLLRVRRASASNSSREFTRVLGTRVRCSGG
jgi:hypothetical protein